MATVDDDDDMLMEFFAQSATRREQQQVSQKTFDCSQTSPKNGLVKRYATFIQRRWVKSVIGSWLLDDEFAAYLLTGEAGSGKSNTIQMLYKTLTTLGLQSVVAVCGTTHAAVNLLPGNPSTYHSAMGFNIAACRAATVEAFVKVYKRKYGRLLDFWERYIKSDTVSAAVKCGAIGHGCRELSNRCAKCMDRLGEHLAAAVPDVVAPRFITSSLLIIDEYAMMSKTDLYKVLWTLDAFSFEHQKRHVLFSGSISQLSTVATNEGIWNAPVFPKIIKHTRTLLLTHRHETDFEFGRALSMMQFNIISREATVIFNQCCIGRAAANDPTHMPGIVRIFNCNSKKDAFNKAALSHLTGADIQLPVDIVNDTKRQRDNDCKLTFSEFFQELKKTYPKIFTERNWNASPKTVKLGCSVMYKNPSSGTPTSMIVMKEDSASKHLILQEPLTNAIHKIGKHTFKSGGFMATFYPVYFAAGINTFCAQGSTIKTGVIYCPPDYYASSPIKPSAYVAMSRVTDRSKLSLSHNPFLTFGKYDFFTEQALHFRKTVELCYQ